jgi:hypothetical protein
VAVIKKKNANMAQGVTVPTEHQEAVIISSRLFTTSITLTAHPAALLGWDAPILTAIFIALKNGTPWHRPAPTGQQPAPTELTSEDIQDLVNSKGFVPFSMDSTDDHVDINVRGDNFDLFARGVGEDGSTCLHVFNTSADGRSHEGL